MKDNYDDIINLPHHTSKRHRPMSMINRAAQFAPFSALTGYDDAIQETARMTDDFVEMDNDITNTLDRKLNRLRNIIDTNTVPQETTITYFLPDRHKQGGSYKTLTTKVKKIDEHPKQIVLSDGSAIAIAKIVDIAIAGDNQQ